VRHESVAERTIICIEGPEGGPHRDVDLDLGECIAIAGGPEPAFVADPLLQWTPVRVSGVQMHMASALRRQTTRRLRAEPATVLTYDKARKDFQRGSVGIEMAQPFQQIDGEVLSDVRMFGRRKAKAAPDASGFCRRGTADHRDVLK